MDTGLKPHSVRRPRVLLSDDTPVNNSPGAHTHRDDARGRKIAIPPATHKTILRPLFSCTLNLSRLIVLPFPRNPHDDVDLLELCEPLRYDAPPKDFCHLISLEESFGSRTIQLKN